MQGELLLIILIGVLVFLALLVLISIENRRRDERLKERIENLGESLKKEVIEIILPVKERLEATKETLGETLVDLKMETRKTVEELSSAKAVLERLSNENRRIQEITDKLSDMFYSTKERGTIGEFLLENILSSFLPDYMWEKQFSIGSDQNRVDAVVKFKNRVIPIDAKFPREDFEKFETSQGEESKRAWKVFTRKIMNHIDVIAKKYIVPEEGTAGYAILFVPSEPMHSIITSPKNPFGEKNEIWDHAVSRKVIIAGPYSLLAIISALLSFSEAESIGKRIDIIYRAIGGAEERILKLEELLNTLKTHLKNSLGKTGEIEQEIQRIKDSLGKIKGMKEDEK